MTSDTTSQSFFEGMYRLNGDPWEFSTNAYELSRYDAIMDALNMPRYRLAFEPGCSVGVLTERLAARCDEVDAIDISPTAVATARDRCALYANVSIRCQSLDDVHFPQNIDVLILSEIGYYFERDRWHTLAERLVNRVVPSGTILAAHWLGHSADHLQHGDDVHNLLHSISCMSIEHSERHSGFRLDRWRKR
jgi:cyclopropane fatty-acyl-phospholipid synthase-like methyltransferase